jgi:hypothetical protein
MTEPRGSWDQKRKDSIASSPAVTGGMKAYDIFSFIEFAVELIYWFTVEVIVPLLSLLV